MIEHYSFGSIKVNGKRYRDDVKIVKGRVVPDWWRASGHLATAADVKDILAAEPEVLVVGKGSSGLMRLDPGLEKELERRGTTLIAEPTARAVQTFNELYAQGRNVAGAFHLTC